MKRSRYNRCLGLALSLLLLMMLPYLLSATDLTAPVVIGVDPGGTDALRVGGSIGSGGVFDALTPNPNLAAGYTANVNAGVPGSRSRAFRFVDRAFIDFELIPGGRGILHFGTDFAGRNNVLSLNTNTGSAIIGVDPGGVDTLRVGGTVGAKGYVSGGVYDASTVNPTLPAGFCAAIAGAIPGQRSRPISFSDRAYIDFELIAGGRGILHFGTDFSGRNNVLSLNTNTGSAIIGADPGGSGQLRVGGGADIKGTARCKEVVVTLLGWADSVFDPTYVLPALAEVSAQIAEQHHLPGVPSEAEIIRSGLAIGDMQKIQMAKIEELTLYAIKADRERAELRVQLAKQQVIIDAIVRQLASKP